MPKEKAQQSSSNNFLSKQSLAILQQLHDLLLNCTPPTKKK